MPAKPATDRRQDRRNLSIAEAIAEAWLRLVAGAQETTICSLSSKSNALALPRLSGIRDNEDGKATIFGLVPGEHIRSMLARKSGFSVAERYLNELARGLALNGTPRIVIWDLDEPLPEDRLRMLIQRTELDLEIVGPDRRDEVLTALSEHITDGLETRENPLLEAWRLLKAWKETREN